MLAGTALCGSGLALAQDAMPGADAGMMTTNKTMAKDDAAFFQKAAMSGMTAIAAAKVAVAKSGNPEIKNFANKMIKDHSQADNERSEERGVGKECVSKWRSRGSASNYKKKTKQ